MKDLKGQKAIVTGGSRGLGLGITEALAAQGVQVTVIARNQQHLDEVKERLGVDVISGDITDEGFARDTLLQIQPTILILNAGTIPPMQPLQDISWDDFSQVWNVDVKGSLYWLQQAIKLPLSPGSRVIVSSSGAAVGGSPLSGSYAGAKRMQWLMADYANNEAKKLGLGITFQAIVPMQIIGDTALGHAAAATYAKRKGVTTEEYLAGFGAPLPPSKVGDHIISILTEPKYETGIAYGMKGDLGIVPLDK